jgi:transposase-like protein
MGRKPKLSVETKVSVCKQYLDGKKGAIELSYEYDINASTIYSWVNKYQSIGTSAFNLKLHNTSYTKKFKQQVVEAYLNGEGSMEHVANRYDIPSHKTLYQWIKKYNNLEELKDYDPKPEVYMKDRIRKTTLEERIEIVNYCLEHDKDYKGTAELFDVSYMQVYQWVRKYLASGEDGLADRRGQHKTEEQLTETEKLQRKVKILERQLREKEMENELLKKVQEIERRRYSRK